MARLKDQNWNLPEGTPTKSGGRSHSWESIHAALLMDIRDELKQLNEALGDYRVRRMSDDVNRIDRRLQKHMPLAQRPRRPA